MEETVKTWIFNLTIGKVVPAAIVVAVVLAISHFLQRYVGRSIEAIDTRYRARKFVNLLDYMVAAVCNHHRI